MMKKTMAMFFSIMLAVSLVGVTYALWSETLVINGKVCTGEVDAEWTVGQGWDTEVPGKDFSNITGYVTGDGKVLVVEVKNAYPCIDYYLPVDINNTGTIPWIIQNITVDFSELPEGTTIEFLPDPQLNPDIAVGVQVHPNQEAYGLLHVHLNNNAKELTTYTFSVTVTVWQWNEYNMVYGGD
jgi:hypothetical protein